MASEHLIFIKKVENRCVDTNVVPIYHVMLWCLFRHPRTELHIISSESTGNKCASSDTAYDYWKLGEKTHIHHSP